MNLNILNLYKNKNKNKTGRSSISFQPGRIILYKTEKFLKKNMVFEKIRGI